MNRLLRRFNLCRETDVIEAMIAVRHALGQKIDDDNYVTDRQWQSAMFIARGERTTLAPTSGRDL